MQIRQERVALMVRQPADRLIHRNAAVLEDPLGIGLVIRREG